MDAPTEEETLRYDASKQSMDRNYGNAVAIVNLKTEPHDKAQGVATALKGLKELARQNVDTTKIDKVALQISPRGANVEPLQDPKQY